MEGGSSPVGAAAPEPERAAVRREWSSLQPQSKIASELSFCRLWAPDYVSTGSKNYDNTTTRHKHYYEQYCINFFERKRLQGNDGQR